MNADTEIKLIVKSLNALGQSIGVETVFRDWCECSALTIANSVDVIHGSLWERREKRYLDVIARYKADVYEFAGMLARLTQAFENDPWCDHLGRIYMECFGGNKNLGQCFTPASVCAACAQLIEAPKDHEPHTLYEPACGGGAMIIAYLKECYDAGYDYQRLLKIYAADLDALCCHMCYVQLSILGARATVAQQNALSLETYDVFETPMERLWPATLTFTSAPSASPSPIQTETIAPGTQLKLF